MACVASALGLIAAQDCGWGDLDSYGAGGKDAGEPQPDAHVDAKADTGTSADSGQGADDASVDSGTDSGEDSGIDSGVDSGEDAGPILGFGPTDGTCPTGTTYTDPFTTDPVASGNWQVLTPANVYTWSTGLVNLPQGSGGTPNSQVWIGSRPNWANYTVSVSIHLVSGAGGGIAAGGGINFRMESASTNASNDGGMTYYIGISTSPSGVQLGYETGGATGIDWHQATLANTPSGAPTIINGTTYQLVVSVSGPTASLNVTVDGVAYLTNYVDPNAGGSNPAPLTYGSFGLRTYLASATYSNLFVSCN